MQHINHNLAQIRRRILLRVWYSYFLSLFVRGSFAYGLVLGGVVAAFGRLTHVAAISHNLLEVPVASVPSYVWQSIETALAGGEVLTVLVTLSMITMSVGAVGKLRTLVQTEARVV